jgi:hypothetical protein
MFNSSCALFGLSLIVLCSSGNALCIAVFLRSKFRHRLITPYFIALLLADSIYFAFRLIKLFYYSQTLFKGKTHFIQSCSETRLAKVYQYATQSWPQSLVPLLHPETYMRFSLILMSIVAVQRTILITRSLKRLVVPDCYSDVHKHRSTLVFIGIAFGLSYLCEFFGLTLFCSRTSNRELSYQWFVYMCQYKRNLTVVFQTMLDDRHDSFECVANVLTRWNKHNETTMFDNDSSCSEKQLIDIVSYAFDQHQRVIVNIIQNILFDQTGHRFTRNEIRRKFHYHECLFPQDAVFFHRHYDFMYNRSFGFNRHSLILGEKFVVTT